ncbi:hypothetical protein [Erythrobacter ani]|uniref:Uncharacterized protein n=1 Tax=Erythrobacter ani TaxID=2827235 RepID=A0ABS6SLP8_9SPHN|nr:hypothetical protein [Erythrobacter ani]MBV7265906.1 hypothetical protein [Erythrobacter ani]
MALPSQGIGFKLDQSDFEASTKKRAKPALFHFLDDNAKPWSRRCDFVVFWRHGNALRADLIEFKSKGIQHDKIVPQLNAGLCWCRSLKHTIEHYTGYKKKIVARKFVFSSNQEPDAFLDANRQLNADVSVRFYHYDELAGMQIGDLQNQSEVAV